MGRIGVIGRDKNRLKVRRSAWPGNNFRKILPSKNANGHERLGARTSGVTHRNRGRPVAETLTGLDATTDR